MPLAKTDKPNTFTEEVTVFGPLTTYDFRPDVLLDVVGWKLDPEPVALLPVRGPDGNVIGFVPIYQPVN